VPLPDCAIDGFVRVEQKIKVAAILRIKERVK
jgi:hypothetical protein